MPSNARDALVAVAALLAPDVPDVVERVTAAHDDPAGFLRAHADRLDERAIDEPVPDLAWIALVDALADHGLLAEVDWKEDPREVLDQLRVLRSAPVGAGAWAWADEVDTAVPTYDFLVAAGTGLLTGGTALAVLDIESDCYPLVLLRASGAEELTGSAAAAGFTASILGDGGARPGQGG